MTNNSNPPQALADLARRYTIARAELAYAMVTLEGGVCAAWADEPDDLAVIAAAAHLTVEQVAGILDGNPLRFTCDVPLPTSVDQS